ncbi:hypothetical protein B9N66_05855 [Campylobacter concisus]|uniref:hypothetical protein n=1 Tax=Campylobacter concisus TaxID=199 RepID=UPI000B3D632C|nr:hypothetical protein [Campylobacter concisus]OUT09424.1 hypothetical protein B9N66_05855 [Campylobacter concisus]
MRIIFKIILALLLAVNLSFATDDYYDSLEKKTIPKKFLNKDCRKLVKKIFCESKNTYVSDTITNMWKEPILMIFFPPKPELKDIERMKNIRYIAYDTKKYSYDFDFKWINKNTLLVQLFDTSPENICELWLYEERNGSVDVYKFTSRYLPD